MPDQFDVAIVGSGLAGSMLAYMLGRTPEVRVALIDPRDSCGECFKAEKLELDQLEILNHCGALPALASKLAPISRVALAHRGAIRSFRSVSQAGMRYHEIVNALLHVLPPNTERIRDKVAHIMPDDCSPQLTLADGTIVHARIVVLAAGAHTTLFQSLELRREVLGSKHFSMATGFDLRLLERGARSWDSLTYYPDSYPSRVAFLTLFPVSPRAAEEGTLRANLFSYHAATEATLRHVVRSPNEAIADMFPLLREILGNFRVDGSAHAHPMQLFRTRSPQLPGVVLVGDTLQSSCPSTGTGVSRVLHDVQILSEEFLPGWLRASRRTKEDIGAFYAHPHKRACDLNAMRVAAYQKRFSLDRSMKWKIHRARVFFGMRFATPLLRAATTRPPGSASEAFS